MIIDCHGHYTTAPQAHTSWRQAQLAAFDANEAPPPYPEISDDEIRESIEGSQLRLMAERGIDLTVFSPRASAMGHHLGDEAVSTRWGQACNDLIARVVELYPDNFIGVCQLPQSPGVPIAHSLAELRRCVLELGFVGCNLNPDPSGGHWTSAPLTDRSWYPFYEAMVELNVPAMVHVSAVTNPNFHATGSHYLNADTTAFMQLIQADLFTDFPDLRLVIPHGGGAVPYHWGRFRGLADMLDRPALEDAVMRNVFFDTCVYHQPGINLLFDVIVVDNILFGSEMVGAVRGIDPRTGHHFDDTRRYVDALDLAAGDRAKVFELNVRRVYPRLDSALKTRALKTRALKARNRQAGAASPTSEAGMPSMTGAALGIGGNDR
jgi:4-oxalmesaconate hydratase